LFCLEANLESSLIRLPRLAFCDELRQPNAIGYAKFFSRSHDTVIRVYNETGNVIDTHEHAGEFKEW